MLQESRRIRTSRESLGRSRQRTRSVAAMHLQHEVVFANVVAVLFTQIEEGIILGVSGNLILWLSRRARKSSLRNSLSVGAAFFSLTPTSLLASARVNRGGWNCDISQLFGRPARPQRRSFS